MSIRRFILRAVRRSLEYGDCFMVHGKPYRAASKFDRSGSSLFRRALEPQEGSSQERADPAARDNAREVTVIRMAQLRSTSPLISGPVRARPRVSHR